MLYDRLPAAFCFAQIFITLISAKALEFDKTQAIA